jgi:hypothetical protein
VNIDLVGILFVVWGALTIVIGASMLALGLGAASLALGRQETVAAGITAAVFTTLALMAILWGAAHIAVGIPIRKRRPWSRLAALMLGAIDLVLLPYGTALGCYALVSLLRESGKRAFVEPSLPQ